MSNESGSVEEKPAHNLIEVIDWDVIKSCLCMCVQDRQSIVSVTPTMSH